VVFTGGVRGISAERIARRMLEQRGFRIIATNHKMESGGEEIAEIDIVAEKDGKKYAVEVKSGKTGLTAVRQVYANATLAGYTPLLICKKIDDAALEAAQRLGVEIMEISQDYILMEPEELESVVKRCMEEVMEEHGFIPYIRMGEEERRVIEAISKAESFEGAAEMAEMEEKEMERVIGNLSRNGILPRRSMSFRDLKRLSMVIMARDEIMAKLEKIEREMGEIKRILKN